MPALSVSIMGFQQMVLRKSTRTVAAAIASGSAPSAVVVALSPDCVGVAVGADEQAPRASAPAASRPATGINRRDWFHTAVATRHSSRQTSQQDNCP